MNNDNNRCFLLRDTHFIVLGVDGGALVLTIVDGAVKRGFLK